MTNLKNLQQKLNTEPVFKGIIIAQALSGQVFTSKDYRDNESFWLEVIKGWEQNSFELWGENKNPYIACNDGEDNTIMIAEDITPWDQDLYQVKPIFIKEIGAFYVYYS